MTVYNVPCIYMLRYCYALFSREFLEGSGVSLAQTASSQVVLLIPALNPDQKLLALLEALKESGWTDPVLLVDDGSSPDHRDIFDRAATLGCHVVRHAKNLGKGRGLKTGFNYCLAHFPDAIGSVTADADGQHTPADIAACADALRASPQSLVMGCRDFASAGVPLRSQLGNIITRNVMRLFCHVRVTDTQTGLRGISSSFMRHMLDVPGERFEYETNMLLETRAQHVPIREVTIQTLYIEGNKSSHFHVLLDSWRIYSLILRFCGIAWLGLLIDLAVAAGLLWLLAPVAPLGWVIALGVVLCLKLAATLIQQLSLRKR